MKVWLKFPVEVPDGTDPARVVEVANAALDDDDGLLCQWGEWTPGRPELAGVEIPRASTWTEPPEEMTVACLLLFGDQAELVPADGQVHDDPARWPAAAIAEGTGLGVADLPGKRFRVRVDEADGRVLFSGFRLLP